MERHQTVAERDELSRFITAQTAGTSRPPPSSPSGGQECVWVYSSVPASLIHPDILTLPCIRRTHEAEPGNHLHKPLRFLREAGGDYSAATARILLWIRPLMPEAGKPVGGRDFLLLTAWERGSEVLRHFFAGKKMRGKKIPVSRACAALWLVGL